MPVKNLLKYSAVVACIWFLVACSAKKSYTTDDMDLPEEFRVPDSSAKDLDSIILTRQEFFKDTVLKQLINDAIKNNFDLRTADNSIAINEAALKQSKAAHLPSLNLGLFNIERNWRSKNSRVSPESDYYDHKGTQPPENKYVSKSEFQNVAALDWELDIWGKLRNQTKAAATLYQQSFVAKRAIQTQLIATIAQDYYSVKMLDEQLEIAERNHEFRDSTLNMIELLYDSGEETALAVEQSEIQVLKAASLIIDLKNEKEILENNLRLLTGELPSEVRQRSGLSIEEDSTYSKASKLPLYLIQNRPDVSIARHDLTIANAEVGVTQAARYPNLNITLEGGTDAMLPENWFNIPGSLLGNAMAGLTAPIFKNRELKTDFEIAKLERDSFEIDFQRTVYEAVVDIRNTQSNLKKWKRQLQITDIKQQKAENAVENSRMLFRSGFADYLEVLNAQEDALESELDLVEAKANFLIERIQLYRALGGGWQ